MRRFENDGADRELRQLRVRKYSRKNLGPGPHHLSFLAVVIFSYRTDKLKSRLIERLDVNTAFLWRMNAQAARLRRNAVF